MIIVAVHLAARQRQQVRPVPDTTTSLGTKVWCGARAAGRIPYWLSDKCGLMLRKLVDGCTHLGPGPPTHPYRPAEHPAVDHAAAFAWLHPTLLLPLASASGTRCR